MLAYIAVFVFALLLGWQIYLQPAVHRLHNLRQEKNALKSAYQIKIKKADALLAQQQVLQASAALQALQQHLAASDDRNAMMEEIADMVRRYALTLEFAKPAQTEMTAQHAAHAVQIRLRGRYHDLGRFTSAVSALPRIVVLSDLLLSAADNNNVTMETLAWTYQRRPAENKPLLPEKISCRGDAMKPLVHNAFTAVLNWMQATMLTLSLLLSGCQQPENATQLQIWLDAQKSQATSVHTPVPPAPPHHPFIYHADPDTAPFGRTEPTTAPIFATRPAQRAAAQPLENFPLESIQMIGTISQEGRHHVLLQADRLVYQARAGDYADKNFGVIREISDSKITLEELIPGADGRWETRLATLTLRNVGE